MKTKTELQARINEVIRIADKETDRADKAEARVAYLEAGLKQIIAGNAGLCVSKIAHKALYGPIVEGGPVAHIKAQP